jgi:hypothetical protein
VAVGTNSPAQENRGRRINAGATRPRRVRPVRRRARPESGTA